MPPRQTSIFDVINQNIVTVSEDIHTVLGEIANLKKEIDGIRAIFNAPEQPDVRGDEGGKFSK